MVLSTECSKCKSAMPNLAQALMFGSKMKVTGYLCPGCGHWNNLKRRKWFRAQLTKLALDAGDSAESQAVSQPKELRTLLALSIPPQRQ